MYSDCERHLLSQKECQDSFHGAPEMLYVGIGEITLFSYGDLEDPYKFATYSRFNSNSEPNGSRTVSISKPFGLAKYETSIAEFESFLQEIPDFELEGCSKNFGSNWVFGEGDDPSSPGYTTDEKESYPAGCLSYGTAKRYIEWLNSKTTGCPYRLPSEAEWMFAATAGNYSPQFDYQWSVDSEIVDQACSSFSKKSQIEKLATSGFRLNEKCGAQDPVYGPSCEKLIRRSTFCYFGNFLDEFTWQHDVNQNAANDDCWPSHPDKYKISCTGEPPFVGAYRDKDRFASPKGSYPPTPFGHFDMFGNVGEITADCWNQRFGDFRGTNNQRPLKEGKCDRAPVLGASYTEAPIDVGAGFRFSMPRGQHSHNYGIRVAYEPGRSCNYRND